MKRGLAPFSRCSALATTRRLLDHARRLAGGADLRLGLGQLGRNHRLEARVAREPKHILDAVLLAPTHQLLPRKTAIRSEPDLDLRPGRAKVRHDARDLRDGAG